MTNRRINSAERSPAVRPLARGAAGVSFPTLALVVVVLGLGYSGSPAGGQISGDRSESRLARPTAPKAADEPGEPPIRAPETPWLEICGNGPIRAPGDSCDDGDPCTWDGCVDGLCEHAPMPNGTVCYDDGNPCTEYTCQNRSCRRSNVPGFCEDDGDPCTNDICRSGLCKHEPISGPTCEDDGVLCTSDVCVYGACEHILEAGLPCVDDGYPCTDDICDAEGGCLHILLSGPTCEGDDNPCTLDVCHNGDCIHPPGNDGAACEDDGDLCTDSICESGACTHPVARCDDADDDPCIVSSYCDPCRGCVNMPLCDGDDGNPCTYEACDPVELTCSTVDVSAPPDEEDLCETYGCHINIDLPPIIPVNNDDDDGDGIPDYQQEVSPTNDEELYPARIWSIGCPPETTANGYDCIWYSPWSWSLRGASLYSGVLFRTLDGVQRDLSQWSLAESPSFEELIEGSRASTRECGQHMRVEFSTLYWGCDCLGDGALVVVVSVLALEWRLPSGSGPCGTSGNAALDACPNNGGVRIFPGKLDPNDLQGATRRQVDLVATIDPPIANVPVYFQVWDVDDPFDQNSPGLANVALIDNDTIGGDNRPQGQTDPAVGYYTVPTDEYGEARVTLTVSMQPGNNYRAAASVIGDVFGGSEPQVSQADADAKQYDHYGHWSGYEIPAVWSRMLTVWRKLWVERDTMAAPDPSVLLVVGPVGAVFPTPLRPGLTTVQIDNPWNASSDLNNYEEGQLVFAGCPSGADTFSVVESTPGSDSDQIPHEVIIFGTPGACAATGTAFILADDDDLTVLGTAAQPHFPDGGTLLTRAFKPAYILPVYALPQYQDVVPFEDYLSYLEIISGEGSWDDDLELTSEPAFWAHRLVGAWEGAGELEFSRDHDGDPDYCFTLFNPPDAREGAESPLTGVTYVAESTSVIFLQGIADEAACTDTTDERHNVVHEIGHAQSGHDDGGIMTEGAPKNMHDFSAISLKKFRDAGAW